MGTYSIDPNADLFPEGIHFFEITGCVEKPTKKGIMQFAVSMRDVNSGRTHSEKWWVEGEWVGMSVGKFKALGLDLAAIDPDDLVGLRFYGKIKHKEGKGDYPPSAQIGQCWSVDKPPKEFRVIEPKPIVEDEDSTPF